MGFEVSRFSSLNFNGIRISSVPDFPSTKDHDKGEKNENDNSRQKAEQRLMVQFIITRGKAENLIILIFL